MWRGLPVVSAGMIKWGLYSSEKASFHAGLIAHIPQNNRNCLIDVFFAITTANGSDFSENILYNKKCMVRRVSGLVRKKGEKMRKIIMSTRKKTVLCFIALFILCSCSSVFLIDQLCYEWSNGLLDGRAYSNAEYAEMYEMTETTPDQRLIIIGVCIGACFLFCGHSVIEIVREFRDWKKEKAEKQLAHDETGLIDANGRRIEDL